MANFVKVAEVADLPPGQGMVVEPEGTPIALFNVEGEFRAIGNSCIHRGGPLGEGTVEEGKVTCPWHAWRFDLATGASELDPSAKVPVYSVEVRDGAVYVDVTAGG
ncbi:MAG: non-heme iron oxygenase ferredoxin subunit [Candidatus Omnitrophica bacterium CG11_big_fil_rev_8_21_14_0_20_64_10]|nr:MAG: non-heme iron oxygenase ferredoxin subunit [Candidatus Omnitrophica bacterium CG11_big_fil_rev_8_21_14_0_20_64_10]